MIIAWLAVLVAIVGALLYALSSNAKVAEMGRILFFVGALAAVLAAGAKTTVHIP
jgi:Na+/phosphate symporter